MKQFKIILGLILLASVTTFAQSPRIKLNQITKDTVKGSVLISSPSDSGMVYSRDFYIAYGADTLLILYGDTIGGVGGGVNSIVTDTITLNGNGTTASPLSVDTATVISTIQGLVDSLSNYVLKGVADTITSEITFTDTIVLQTYDEGTVSVSSDGRVKTEPAIQTLSLGEGYADVAKEYHITDGKTVYPNSLGYMYAELLRLNLLSKASLILTPTAIATGVVASQKPLSTDGDFTFTRSTSATRVNENGYIEKETQNLLLQSNTFNTTWATVGAFVTSGQSGYDGTNNAWLLTADTPSPFSSRIEQSITLTKLQTYSVYAKAGTSDYVLLEVTGTNGYYAWFNLSTGVVGTKIGDISTDITSVGNGWYRCSITGNPSSTSNARIFIADNESGTGVVDGNYIYIQDAQLEQGLVARDYIETTTSAVYGGITDNVPRIDYTDYLNPSLLLEPQRTNLITHSEYLDLFDKTRCTITQNALVSPQGLNNAAKITQTTTTAWGGIVSTYLPSDPATLSVFAKKIDNDFIAIIGHNSNDTKAYFDLANGTVGTIGTDATSASIEDFGNGWYRCIMTASNVNRYTILHATTDEGITAPIGSETALWGCQLEQSASYPTSYIPTYGTSVTRLADEIINTNASDLIGQTEGTIFIKTNDTKLYTDISDSTSSNRIVLYTDSSGYIRNLIVSGGTTSSEIQTSTTIAKGDKIAMAYKGNDVVIYKNGLQIVSDTSVTVPSTKQINVGTNYASAISDVTDVNNYLLFKTRLSNTELAELTKQ